MSAATHTGGMLAYTVGLLLIALLRRPWRRWFGAERAYALWFALPLAMLTTWLPHTQAAVIYAHVGEWLAPPAPLKTAHALPQTAEGIPGGSWLGALWLLGSLVWVTTVLFAQYRYTKRLRGARLTNTPGTIWRVVTSSDTATGPALIGVWRPRIVLPSDFATRFDATERALIIHHESIHAQRRDSAWILLAHALAAVFWFHPGTWWALRAFRQDQELACDAVVVRERPADRRAYAAAMLKTHDATFLPIGCTWTSHHPLTERIAMLKAASPSRTRRNVAAATLPFALIAIAGVAYASSPGSSAPSAASTYQLTMKFEEQGAAVASPTICLAANAPVPATVRSVTKDGKDAWELAFTVRPQESGQLQIQVAGTFSDNPANTPATQRVTSQYGQPVVVHFDKGTDTAARTLYITPARGCPAAAQKTVVQVSDNAHSATARATAATLASRGRLTLVNPDVLDEKPVGFNFEGVDVRDAIRHVAEIDGRTASFDGDRVSFAVK